jgi:hypothetical protein
LNHVLEVVSCIFEPKGHAIVTEATYRGMNAIFSSSLTTILIW